MRGWRLRRFPVCGSTEWELERWLRGLSVDSAQLDQRLAVVAARQRHGQGQQGRHWSAPVGGVWLSATFPWPSAPSPGSGVSASLGLALALGLVLQLECIGLPVCIKWPNDLLLAERKLAGLLPRLRWRGGRVRWAQAGIGLNGINRVPPGAIALAEALAPAGARRCRWHPQAMPRQLEPRVLAALDWAIAHAAEAEQVRREAEARLWRPAEGLWLDAERWWVDGLEVDGRLRLERGGRSRWLARGFPALSAPSPAADGAPCPP